MTIKDRVKAYIIASSNKHGTNNHSSLSPCSLFKGLILFIHRINHYPEEKYWGDQLRYPVDSDLFGGKYYRPI